MTEEFKAYIKKLTDAQLYSLLWICNNYDRNKEYTTAVIAEMDRREKLLEDLKQRLKEPPAFEVVLGMLDEYTVPPEDGDYDRHTQEAMRAVYDIMMNHINKAEE